MYENVHTQRRFQIIMSRMSEHSTGSDDWRRSLRRKVAWAVAAKLAALMVLWFCFFRGGHT
jgi:type VI protein secretion system component VasF